MSADHQPKWANTGLAIGIGITIALGALLLLNGNAADKNNSDDNVDKADAYCSIAGNETKAYDSEAAPYAGSGPHPVTLFPDESVGNDTPVAAYLPKEWKPRGPRKLQLVVCEIERTERSDRTCDYAELDGPEERSFHVYETVYSYDVFEAKTGKRVTHFIIQGIGGMCPPEVSVGNGGIDLEGSFSQQPNTAAFREKLRQYVEEPVR